ncbi:uncharacterized protein GGS25DRAFT_449224 [Hypoxylon fragiforme]|uniref:uncharacterized protein n=1 Tax=Hypoxylon fragiforme TaxID=63214 RepID=UPI0020C735F6|nr:uncharacterized protein GGS25DRAFT_449224 [Hypoxylon fragiforme]KAI2604130.1 hypothetical protein GGS25DRAFT_449224 [Hypoxylon fragiforme]
MPPLPALRLRATSILPSSTTSISTPISRALFSSTATRPSGRVPPESPLFINVPNPPQDQSIEALRELPPIKGHLPVPRQVFKKKDGHLKPQDEWFAKSAPPPTSEKQQREPRSEIQAWKRRVASSRRENMRQGVRALYARKQNFDTRRHEQQVSKLSANLAAAKAPEREDERLTRATVNAGTLSTTVILDPERFERALASRETTQNLAKQKSERRRDAIQELYMKARSFIVTEQDLEEKVNELFAPDYWSKKGISTSGFEIHNIWDVAGKQPTVDSMLADVSRTSNSVIKDMERDSTKTVKRQKEIAEELTGAKLDDVESKEKERERQWGTVR